MARKESFFNTYIAGTFDRISSAVRGTGDEPDEGGGGKSNFAFYATCASILAAVAFLVVFVPRMRSYLELRSFVASNDISVRFLAPPAWLDQRRHEELRNAVANAVGDGSSVDPARLAIARAALEQTGWFKDIRQVSLEGIGGFAVDAEFRTPFALVVYSGLEHLIDSDGCRMPAYWTLGERPANPHWVTFVNVAEPPPGEPGKPWRGADLAAGIELLKVLWNRPWERQVAAIDVSRVQQDGLIMLTRGGGYIYWGYPPGLPTAAEPTPEAKLRNLDYLFSTTGFVDSGGGRVVDLRTDMPSVKLAAETPRAQ